jgi:hypothetical protein
MQTAIACAIARGCGYHRNGSRRAYALAVDRAPPPLPSPLPKKRVGLASGNTRHRDAMELSKSGVRYPAAPANIYRYLLRGKRLASRDMRNLYAPRSERCLHIVECLHARADSSSVRFVSNARTRVSASRMRAERSLPSPSAALVIVSKQGRFRFRFAADDLAARANADADDDYVDCRA